MKKYILLILAAALALSGCQKQWQWSGGDLGVNSTRINLAKEGGPFTVSVFSDTGWTALVTRGADWLKLEETSGSGLGTIHLESDQNFEDPARVAILELTADTGKVIEVNIVQSGTKETATSIPDDLL
jgi:hypothetical protein